MIELVQLQHLIAVSEHGTISAAADVMHLSQPALTRSLQRLEKELGVTLFDRKRNRAVLNQVGELAVNRAKAVLASMEDLAMDLQVYAARLSTIAIGSCGPAPMWDLAAELGERYPEHTIASELADTETLISGLQKGRYRLILTDRFVELPGVLCRRFTEERLCVALPLSHPLSGRASVRLAELGNERILCYRDMGIWQRIIANNPSPRYLVQSDREILTELISASDLPCFSSNLTGSRIPLPGSRVRVPLADEEASVTFFLCAREVDRALFQKLC